ncbi:stage II sporulation protein M [Candidatus Woesearchaeota archaeon]|nr:stage II sporulation protein M [Candidatus Woesearchaeota archaeon]
MVVESLITPWKMENKPTRMAFFGFLYASVAIFLGLWVFKAYSSLIMVFLATMASIPLIYNTIKIEEEKGKEGLGERHLLKEHSRAVNAFMFLFVGMVLAFTLWYIVLPSHTVTTLFNSQTETINDINGRAIGFTINEKFSSFSNIFLNNVRVLMFCVIFSFLYGSGAIFILTWNASVIGTAIGDFIRQKFSALAGAFGFSNLAEYLAVVGLGLTKYIIHGIPEILAYFTAGLGGGIISVAVIKHDMKTKKFEHILLDAADLVLISLFILVIAAFLEVFVTPLIF